jgi:hypothetical protein
MGACRKADGRQYPQTRRQRNNSNVQDATSDCPWGESMKIILSRKGFDSKYGKIPSPILPCGRLLSLPIPEVGEGGHAYADLSCDGLPLSTIITQLGGNAEGQAHLDPDLDRGRLAHREDGWRAAFGQTGNAQIHLENQRVASGDLFLFFGWFRHTELLQNVLRFKRPHRELHVIFGWLQIGEIYRVSGNQCPQWLQYHSHFRNHGGNGYQANNTIYTATPRLTLGGRTLSVRGAGTFPGFNPSLQLTDPDETRRTYWRLPRWFYPPSPRQALSCHANPDNWTRTNQYAFLRSQPIGQEFVLNTRYYPEANEWVMSLFGGIAVYPEA